LKKEYNNLVGGGQKGAKKEEAKHTKQMMDGHGSNQK